MSYATMQDVSFALDLTDRELPDRPKKHSNIIPAAEPEPPKQRSEAGCATKRESKRKPAAARRAA